jgi:hypothetical protein
VVVLCKKNKIERFCLELISHVLCTLLLIYKALVSWHKQNGILYCQKYVVSVWTDKRAAPFAAVAGLYSFQILFNVTVHPVFCPPPEQMMQHFTLEESAHCDLGVCVKCCIICSGGGQNTGWTVTLNKI